MAVARLGVRIVKDVRRWHVQERDWIDPLHESAQSIRSDLLRRAGGNPQGHCTHHAASPTTVCGWREPQLVGLGLDRIRQDVRQALRIGVVHGIGHGGPVSSAALLDRRRREEGEHAQSDKRVAEDDGDQQDDEDEDDVEVLAEVTVLESKGEVCVRARQESARDGHQNEATAL